MHNADLDFASADAARDAPQILRDRSLVDSATGVLVAEWNVDEPQARRMIADAARRAGQDELSVAREIVHALLRGDDPT